MMMMRMITIMTLMVMVMTESKQCNHLGHALRSCKQQVETSLLVVASLSFFQQPSPPPAHPAWLNAETLRPSRRKKRHKGKPPTHPQLQATMPLLQPDANLPNRRCQQVLLASHIRSLRLMHLASFNQKQVRSPPTEFRAFISDDLEAVISAPTDSSIKWVLRRSLEAQQR